MMAKATPDFARISLAAGDNFYEIALVKAEGREQNLRLAIQAYSAALSFYTVAKFHRHHAATQNNLGNAFREMAEVRDKEDNLKLAIQAYREALKTLTPQDFPVQYGLVKMNLALLYLFKAYAEAGKARKKPLQEAEAAAQESLKSFEQEGLQEDIIKAREVLDKIGQMS